MLDCTYPPAVPEGGTVALVAPSHGVDETTLQRGRDRLRSFGVEPRTFETAERDTDWLRAHPAERAADLERAFADDAVDGVVAVMGGNAAHELLPYLDPAVLAEHPTRFYGGSDNTHVHLVCQAAGLVSFYGGQLFPDLTADPEVHPYTRETVERALRNTPFGAVEPAGEWTDEYYDPDEGAREWFPGPDWYWRDPQGHDPEYTVRAPVMGGCVSMLETQLMLDAPYFTEETVEGCVLAVETSGETPDAGYVERFLSILGEREMLGSLEGLVVGKPETPASSLDEREAYRDNQRSAVVEQVDRYAPDLPVVFDLDFGHAAPVLPLPLGAEAVVDGGSRSIAFAARDDRMKPAT